MKNRTDVGTAHEHEYFVDDLLCKVWAVKTGISTWSAYGDFRGRRISVTGRTETEALSSWRDSADYHARE